MHVVTVTFVPKPDRQNDFLPLMLENARVSLAEEPGCRQFDVSADEDGTIFLYELYDDEAAFKKHLSMPHFLEFSERTEDMVLKKTVSTYTLVREGET